MKFQLKLETLILFQNPTIHTKLTNSFFKNMMTYSFSFFFLYIYVQLPRESSIVWFQVPLVTAIKAPKIADFR